MRIKAKRKNDVPGRAPGDFKPWLDHDAVEKVALQLKLKGCGLCGATTSPVILEGPDGKLFPGEQWHPRQQLETGEEQVVCASCYEEYRALETGCAVCRKNLVTYDGRVGEWNVQYDNQTNKSTSALCPACYDHHTQKKGCDRCGVTGELWAEKEDGNMLRFIAPPLVPEPIFICTFCLKMCASERHG